MKRTIKSIAGVTLLEIMLVLAIAAMIITMSVKYYQTANNSAHINAGIEQITAIAAGADSYAQTMGSYSGVNASTLGQTLPGQWNFTPWGTKVTVSATGGTLTIVVPSIPGEICTTFNSKLTANSHFTISSGTCNGTATPVSITYVYSP